MRRQRNAALLQLSIEDWYRFWSKVEKTTGCWWWTAALKDTGYGEFNVKHIPLGAHRIAYAMIRGEVPTEMELDHLCHHPACVNPNHLEAVPHRVNCSPLRSRAGNWQKNKTHCPAGHPLVEGNLLKRKPGHRVCRICHYVRVKRWNSKNG